MAGSDPTVTYIDGAAKEKNQQARVIDSPSWITNPKAWLTVTLDNVVIPGTVYLKKNGLHVGISHQKANGKDFGGTLITGMDNPEFSLEVHLWTREDELAFDQMRPNLIKQKKPTARDAVPVYHPELAKQYISSCLVHGYSLQGINRGGAAVYEIQCVAMTPPRDNVAKRVNAKTGGGSGPTSPKKAGNSTKPSTRPQTPPSQSGASIYGSVKKFFSSF